MNRVILCFFILLLVISGCENRSNTEPANASAGNQNLTVDQTSSLKQHKPGLLLVIVVGQGCGKKSETVKQARASEAKDQESRRLVSPAGQTDTVDEMVSADENLLSGTSTSPEIDEADTAAQVRELADSLSEAMAQEQTTAGKLQIINSLIGVHDPSVVDTLLTAMEPGESSEVREAATKALSSILQPEIWYGNTDGLDYFVYALDPDLPVKVRASAVQVLEYTNDVRVESILQDLRNDSNPEIRSMATDALNRINNRNQGNPTGGE